MAERLSAPQRRQTRCLLFAVALNVLIALQLNGCSASRPEKRPGSAIPLKTFASMAPSNTELIYDLGLEKRLVAVCTQCDYPPQVKEKPKIGSFTSVDLERLRLMQPDAVFLVNGQEALASNIENHGVEARVLNNNSVAAVAANVRSLGSLTGEPEKASALADDFERHVQQLKSLTSSAQARPRVFFCVWPDPLVTVGSGSYLNDAVTICGGTNIAGNLTADYPHYSAERLVLEQPDQIILPNEAHNDTFLRRSPWMSLKAVQQKKVFFLPPRDEDRLSRPTIRLQEGLVWLASRIHPELADAIAKQSHTWQDVRTAEHHAINASKSR